MSTRPAEAPVPTVTEGAATPEWRVALIAGAVLAAAVVLLIGQQDAAAQAARAADPELTMLLRLMAAIKAGAAIGLLWLAQWRLRRPVSPGLAASMTAAGMLMACGPALIWTMAGIGLGALCFYAGLGTLLALLWTDRATVTGLLGALAGRRK